ncbi:MAG: uracil-DNA glycosylase [Alphaproteobacteria bacterium]
MVAALSPDALEALLVFYRDAGIDCAVGDIAVDRFAESDVQPVRRSADQVSAASGVVIRGQEGVGSPQRPAAITAVGAPPAPEAALSAAREAASSAQDLDALLRLVESFDGCALKATASRTVFEDGTRGAPIMFVGEAPGREEDLEGKPFVGRSGQLLDRMMGAIGLDRSGAYIANVIPWRPPGNRTPTPQEIAICLPFITRQIELAQPKLLVCLGSPAMQTLLGIKDGIMRARGRVVTYRVGAREIPALATLHPAYLLRSPIAKRQAWRDFLTIRSILDDHGTGGTKR